MGQYNYDKSEYFKEHILPRLEELSQLCQASEIPIVLMASAARTDDEFNLWSRVAGNPSAFPERMVAAAAVAIPDIARQLIGMAGEIAARFVQKVAAQETGYDADLAELLRLFSAATRMGVTAHAIMRRDLGTVAMLDVLPHDPDIDSENMRRDPITGIDKVIRTVFTTRTEDSPEGIVPPIADDLVGLDELPEQFRDLFRDIFNRDNPE